MLNFDREKSSTETAAQFRHVFFAEFLGRKAQKG